MSETPLFLSCQAAQDLLGEDELIRVDLCEEACFQRHHLPGAQHVMPAETQSGVPPAPGDLPDPGRLHLLLRRLGIRPSSSVLIYDDEGGGWAGRFLWLMHCLGIEKCHILDGGIRAWLAENRPVESGPSAHHPRQGGVGDPMITTDTRDYRVELQDVLERLEGEQLQIWDARSPAEFSGQRQLTRRNGHIPGAINYEWTRCMVTDENLQLRPLPEIAAELQEAGLKLDREIITHCQAHHRSGLTYAVGRALGLDIKAYPGSWYEWGNHPETPVASN